MSRLLNSGFIVAVLVALFAALVLSTAYGYSGISGTFPQLVGWIFLGLALLEVLVQVLAVRKPARAPAPQAEARQAGSPDADNTSAVKEMKGFLWLGGLLLGLYLVGFMVSTPLYVFAFLRFSGGRGLGMSAAVAAGATAFVYVVFIQLLEYKLYPGILLAG